MKYIKYGHGKWIKDRYGSPKSTFKPYVISKPAGLSQFYKLFFDADAYYNALQEALILLKNKK